MREWVNARRNPVTGSERPRVALLVETSLASGRDILRGIARYVREHEPWALFHEPHGITEPLPKWLRRWRGDGIIARIQTPAMADDLLASRIPVVDVLGGVADLPFPLVHVNNAAISRMAADHMVERGLHQFGFFGIPGENWSDERYVGFCAAVAAASKQNVALYQLPRDATGQRSWERVEKRLAQWVSSLPKPSGVMICSDQRGSQFLEACRRAGVSIPDELAVIGVDNDEPLCEVCDPPLSSIEANHTTVGYQAAAVLESLLHGNRAPKGPLLIKPQRVIARLSTEMLSIADPAIVAAMRLIRDLGYTGLSVDAVARHVGLSRSVLQRRFRALLNRTVHREILTSKIKRAEELLIKTDLPLATVAERAGFKYGEYMGAVFKARLGRTPAEVRNEHG